MCIDPAAYNVNSSPLYRFQSAFGLKQMLFLDVVNKTNEWVHIDAIKQRVAF